MLFGQLNQSIDNEPTAIEVTSLTRIDIRRFWLVANSDDDYRLITKCNYFPSNCVHVLNVVLRNLAETSYRASCGCLASINSNHVLRSSVVGCDGQNRSKMYSIWFGYFDSSLASPSPPSHNSVTHRNSLNTRSICPLSQMTILLSIFVWYWQFDLNRYRSAAKVDAICYFSMTIVASQWCVVCNNKYLSAGYLNNEATLLIPLYLYKLYRVFAIYPISFIGKYAWMEMMIKFLCCQSLFDISPHPLCSQVFRPFLVH